MTGISLKFPRHAHHDAERIDAGVWIGHAEVGVVNEIDFCHHVHTIGERSVSWVGMISYSASVLLPTCASQPLSSVHSHESEVFDSAANAGMPEMKQQAMSVFIEDGISPRIHFVERDLAFTAV